MNIFGSATRIVLLIMVISFCGLTFIGKVDPKDFVNAVSLVLAFYFGQKTAAAVNEPIQNNTNNQ